jgi:hypothetical protein
MSSLYPEQLDNLPTDKTDATVTRTVHAALHNRVADAINKMQGYVGVGAGGPVAGSVLAGTAPGVSEWKTASVALGALVLNGPVYGIDGRSFGGIAP